MDARSLIRKRAAKCIALPAGWARNTVNTSIYRGAGLLTASDFQFGAYYESAESMVLFRRSLTTGELAVSRLGVTAAVKDAHNGISIGCDHDGYLHLSHNQHGSKLSYLQSARPYDISSWSSPRAMSGVWEDMVTYPYFLSPAAADQPLLFLYRSGVAVSGDVHLKLLDSKSRRWRDLPAPVLAGSQLTPWASGPYFNHPAVDRFGKLHLFFTWRTRPSGIEGRVNNHNIDYACSSDWGLSWEASNGEPIPLPITPVNSETLLGTPPGSGLMNQCGAAADSFGRPFVTFYMGGASGVSVFLMWHDGLRWRERVLADVHEGFELKGRGTLRLPISRPDLVMDRLDRAWIIYRQSAVRNRMIAVRLDGPDYDVARAETFLLHSGNLGFTEPVIDRARLVRDGILSLFLQRTEQGDHEGLLGPPTSPVFVADWSLE
jgi:BNR repeat-containing family member